MLFLDANAILYYLHDVKPYSHDVEDITSREDELYTSIRVLDEIIVYYSEDKSMGKTRDTTHREAKELHKKTWLRVLRRRY